MTQTLGAETLPPDTEPGTKPRARGTRVGRKDLPPPSDLSAPDDMPTPAEAPKPRGGRGLTAAAKAQLVSLHALMGMGVNTLEIASAARKGGFPDHLCGNGFIQNAEGAVDALDKLAQANPKVRRILERLAEGSAYSELIGVYFPIIMSIAQHHIPAFQRGMEIMNGGAPAPAPEPTPDNVVPFSV